MLNILIAEYFEDWLFKYHKIYLRGGTPICLPPLEWNRQTVVSTLALHCCYFTKPVYDKFSENDDKQNFV